MTKPLICDFCSDPDPAHRIRCASFDVHDIVPVTRPMTSVGDFLACDICNGYIRVGNKRALVDRARTSFIERHGRWGVEAEMELREFYRQFWEHRILA